MSEPFTIVLPIRDTDKEYEFMKKSLKSAIKLNPAQLILGLDAPASERIIKRAIEMEQQYDFHKIMIKEVSKNDSWGFQLANIVWHCYKSSFYDKILSFDVDSILDKNVLVGLEQVGKDNIAVVSFTKKLLTKYPHELIRYMFYRWRVRQSNYVFSGVYWIYKPFYFEDVEFEKYQKIRNGVDTIMCQEILAKNRHLIVTRKEIGVNCMTKQNEDLDWRQFQDGLWIGANHEKFKELRKKKRLERIQQLQELVNRNDLMKITKTSFLARRARLWIREQLLDVNALSFVLLRTFLYMHPYFLLGYLWARLHSNSEAVTNAKKMDEYQWGYEGSKYLTFRKWHDKGAGFVQV